MVTLVGNCLKVCGRYDELKAHLKKQLQTKSGEEAFRTAIELADLYYADGDTKAMDASLEEGKKKSSGTGNQYSISAWYQEKGLYEKAASKLEEELNELGRQQWLMDQARPRLQRMKLASDDLAGALDLTFKKMDEAANFGEKDAAFRGLITLLRSYPDPSTVKDKLFAAADAAGRGAPPCIARPTNSPSPTVQRPRRRSPRFSRTIPTRFICIRSA